MKFKFNPLTGEFNLVPDSGTLKQKLNWLTGNFNLTKDAGKYKQIYNVIEGEFNLYPATTQVVVHGVGSIQLTNAVENGLLSLTAYGGTEQNGTPTPDNPVDIVCNNGTLKLSKNMANVNAQTALVGYYISTAGVVTADVNNRIYQDYIPCKPSTKYTLSISAEMYYVTISEYSTADDSGFVVRKAGSSGGNTQLTITTGSNTNYLRFGANMYRNVALTLDDVLAVNWQLEEGDTPTPYNPYAKGGVYADGTTETIGLGLTYSAADGQGTFVSPSATTTTRIYKAFGQLATGTYTVEVSGPFDFIFQYKDTIDTTPIQYGNIGTRTKSGEYTITDEMYYGVAIRNDSGTGNIRPADFVSGNGKISIKGADGNVVAEMLLKVGDYADEQEILSGNVTRKVRIRVFDGTENWAYNDLYSRFFITVSDLPIATSRTLPFISTHYKVSYTVVTDPGYIYNGSNRQIMITDTHTSVESWTQWLADQYNAGTPVIIVYLLATPTTEAVAGQTMNIPKGDSTIEITQASIDNLELEAVYEQEA